MYKQENKRNISAEKQIVVSGIRPTGFLHLGNYFGAVRNFVSMQDEYACYFFIADWHALTTHREVNKALVRRVVAEYIAAGLDATRCAIYLQSDLPQTAELYLYLNMLSYMGELQKTASFKDKVRAQPDNVNAGLLTYPVLMAADILIHNAHFVPVGQDQQQHLEMARNFADRFNHRYGKVFRLPKAFNFGDELIKIRSLDGRGKMSKSENEASTIYLADSDEQIRKKIMKAKTDSFSGGDVSSMSDATRNLFHIMELVSSPDMLEYFASHYEQGTLRYGDMKKVLAEDLINLITPIREAAKLLNEDVGYIRKVLREGSEKARESGASMLARVREKMDFSAL